MRDDRCAEKKCVWFELKNNKYLDAIQKRKANKFQCVIKFAKIDLEWIELETARTIWH